MKIDINLLKQKKLITIICNNEKKQQIYDMLKKDDISILYNYYNLNPSLTIKENIGNDNLYNLKEYLDYYPNDLSADLQQIASILKVLNEKKEIVLLDEPFKYLDDNVISNFLNIFKNDKRTIIILSNKKYTDDYLEIK